jgi:hypothetical protein
MSAAPLLSSRWVSLYPAVYFAHLLDERFFGVGTALWWMSRTGVYFTNSGWLAVNIPWFAFMCVAAWAVAMRRLPSWVELSLATHLALHALVRIVGSLVFLEWSPGVMTGVILCLPVAGFSWIRARELSGRERRIGILCGVLSFQPVWHTVLLPLLPQGPA